MGDGRVDHARVAALRDDVENFGVTESNWRDALDPARAQSGQPVPHLISRCQSRLATLVVRSFRSRVGSRPRALESAVGQFR